MSHIENTHESKLLSIKLNKGNRLPNQTKATYKANLNNTQNMEVATRVVPIRFNMTHTFYNVNADTNTFTFTHSVAGALSVQVVEGQYNTAQLMTDLATAINAVITPDVVTITENLLTNKVTFSLATGTAIWNANDSSPTPSPLSHLLGIATQSADLALFTGQDQVDLGGLKNVHITSSTLAPFNGVSNRDKGHIENTLLVVPVKVDYGAELFYESFDDEVDSINHLDGKNIQHIDIQLRDENDNVLDIGSHEAYLLLKVYHG